MLALYIILGIIVFIIGLMSMPLTVIVDYAEKTLVIIKFLFVKITVFDSSKPKKEKKSKKEKKPKETTEETTPEAPKKGKGKKTETNPEEMVDTTTEEKTKPKTKNNSLLKQIYTDHGYDGIVKMLSAIGNSLNGFFGKLYKTVVFDELYIQMVTATGDASSTAIKHGQLCAWAYPILGKLVSTCKVKKYDFHFSPDFLANKSEASAYVRLHVTPIHITNGAVVLAVQLLFKVLIKLLFSKTKHDKSKAVKTVADTVTSNSTDEYKK